MKSDFSSLGIPNLDRLPAIRWKLQNLETLKDANLDKWHEQYDQLVKLFS